MKNTIIVTGNPVQGFTYIGPFDDEDAAIRYGEQNCEADWWLATLWPDDSATLAALDQGQTIEQQANALGFQIRHDMHGFYALTLEEADAEDTGNASAGFDGRPHFASMEAAALEVLAHHEAEEADARALAGVL